MGVKSSPFCARQVNLSARLQQPRTRARPYLDVVHEAEDLLLVEDGRYRPVDDLHRDVYSREVACREF